MKKVILVLFFLSLSIYSRSQVRQSAEIDEIVSYEKVLDEWKNPGLYSPVNIIDGEIITSYAEGNEKNNAAIKILFNKPVYIDEIRILNGNSGDAELFRKYSRAAKIGFNFYSPDAFSMEVEPDSESFALPDQPGYQSLKLKQNYQVRMLELFNYCQSLKSYKGEGSDDIFITEIEFYCQGMKIEINNVDMLKKRYVSSIEKKLRDLLSNKKFIIEERSAVTEMLTYDNGVIIYNVLNVTDGPPLNAVMPDRWKVQDSKLYMRLNKRWILYNYEIVQNSIVLNTNPYSAISAGFKYRSYYKNLPENYQIIMAFKQEITRNQ